MILKLFAEHFITRFIKKHAAPPIKALLIKLSRLTNHCGNIPAITEKEKSKQPGDACAPTFSNIYICLYI